MQIKKILDKFSQEADSDQQLAVKIHDYVRDHIQFGFTRRFDQADALYTLNREKGHCNPKGVLLMECFNQAGFKSYQHFMLIKKSLLKGCLPFLVYQMLPPLISHSMTDVCIEGEWYSLDSYVLDKVLFQHIQKRLREEKQSIGFGSHLKATCEWNGKEDAFSQAGESQLLVEDHGRITDIEDYYRSSAYHNKTFGIPIGRLLKWLGPGGLLWEKFVNSVLVKMRN